MKRNSQRSRSVYGQALRNTGSPRPPPPPAPWQPLPRIMPAQAFGQYLSAACGRKLVGAGERACSTPYSRGLIAPGNTTSPARPVALSAQTRSRRQAHARRPQGVRPQPDRALFIWSRSRVISNANGHAYSRAAACRPSAKRQAILHLFYNCSTTD